MLGNQAIASSVITQSSMTRFVMKETKEGLSAKLRSVAQVDATQLRWSAVIYLLIHHPQRKKLNTIVDFEHQRIHAGELEKKLTSENWSFVERYLLAIALYLYDDVRYANQVDFSRFHELSESDQQIILNAIEIRLGSLNFADTLLADLEGLGHG